MNYPYNDFPVHYLPDIIRNAVLETHQNVGAPIGLIAASALNAMSLSCQQLANVKRRDNLISPCSLFFLTIAESGERKSAVDKLMLQSIRDFEALKADKYRTELSAFEMKLKSWKAIEKSIERKIAQGVKLGRDIATPLSEMETVQTLRPMAPRHFRYLFSDTTPEALLDSLSQNWPAAGLVSDESDGILNGGNIKSFAPYNLAWDGAPQTIDRKTSRSFVILEARLAISMMIQPEPFRAFMGRRGNEAISTGFLARFLVSYPLSTQGHRAIGLSVPSWQHLPLFQERIGALIERSYHAAVAGVPAIDIKFSPDAQRYWNWAHDEFERHLGIFGKYSQTKEHAAKAADNIARMAACFQYFCEDEGDITRETIEKASAIVHWYEEEYARLFTPIIPPPQHQLDANQLDQWLQSKCPQRYFRRNYIRQYAPYSLRNLAHLEPALQELAQRGRIRVDCYNDTQIIDQYPLYPFDPVALEHGMRQGKKQSQV